MTASALNLAFPTQPQAAGPAGAAAPKAGAGAFEALLGALFGAQTGLAAELFAGAAPGAKTDAGETPADGETTHGDLSDAAQALALAGAMAMPPAPPLVASLPAQPAEGEPAAAGAPAIPSPVLPQLAEQAMAGTPADPTQQPVSEGAKGQAASTPPANAMPMPAEALDAAAEPPPAPAQQAAAAATETPAQPLEAPVPPTAAPPAPAPARNRVATAHVTNVSQAAAGQPAPDQPVQAVQPQAETQARSALGVDAVDAAPAAPQEETADLSAPETPSSAQAQTAKAETASVDAPTAAAATPVRGSPETVAQLAAHIVKKLDGRSTRFDVELEPLGLGKVDVRVEIGAHGRLTAALSFENPQAVTELRSRANELTRALEQAGFDLSGGLSFDVADQRGQQNQPQGDQNQAGAAWRGRAFQAALDQAGDAVEVAVSGALNLQRRWNAGVDIRI